ncbi:hypothetical protein M404DRAFT_28448 [Pisolithus tinctorius Marx 270]|uniref:CCHC-type domain-containing protein n=1 Tax=Pisolithus tinctorius Marx 270 TaxID=870435 RepID=A0A0C3P2J7_PISTI|nr:hypothetical protein M404DRAFT_28448 [Pisolithus tinctorius Marx 270]
MALAWFEPDLLNPKGYDHPLWMDNYHKFLHELTTNFGLHDAIVDSIQQLENLTLKDIKDYGVGALCHCFYSGLPDCIKDEITHIGKPSTLTQLHKLTQTVNACYWEHKAEISCTIKSATDKSQSSNSDNKSKSSSSTSTPKSNTRGKGKQKDLPKSNIAHLLGKDGKLTSAECQCRMKNNLCLFCGKAGHSTKDCPKFTSHTAKAHAAMAGIPPALPMEKAEPKN